MVSKADDDRRDLFPGAIEMMVLKLLMSGPLHGYGLAQQIKRGSDDLLRVEEGSLYPALQRMLKEKLLTADWGVSASNRKVRLYRVTALGKKKLARDVSNFEEMMKGFKLVMKPVNP